MASGPVEIANLALSWLGGQSIISLDDPTTEAQLVKANYNMSRRAVLEEREWTFAVKRAQLPPLAAPPLFGYNFAFLLPSERLNLINVYHPNTSNQRQPPGIEHVVEGDQVYADVNLINVKYRVDLDDTTKFSPLFDQALAAHIAARIAVPLTENATQQERMYNLYQDALIRATSADSLQGSREMLEISQLEQSRRMFVTPS